MNTTTLTSTTELTASEAAFAGGLVGTFMVAVIVFIILIIVAEWRIFEKAGEKGWKSLIPIYGQYILFKIIGAKAWFWIYFCVTIICSIMMSVNSLPVDFNASQEVVNAQVAAIDWAQYVPFLIGTIVSAVMSIVVNVYVCYRLAKAFGKGIGYTLGLIFFPEIVLLVLGFGKAKYNKKAVNA